MDRRTDNAQPVNRSEAPPSMGPPRLPLTEATAYTGIHHTQRLDHSPGRRLMEHADNGYAANEGRQLHAYTQDPSRHRQPGGLFESPVSSRRPEERISSSLNLAEQPAYSNTHPVPLMDAPRPRTQRRLTYPTPSPYPPGPSSSFSTPHPGFSLMNQPISSTMDPPSSSLTTRPSPHPQQSHQLPSQPTPYSPPRSSSSSKDAGPSRLPIRKYREPRQIPPRRMSQMQANRHQPPSPNILIGPFEPGHRQRQTNDRIQDIRQVQVTSVHSRPIDESFANHSQAQMALGYHGGDSTWVEHSGADSAPQIWNADGLNDKSFNALDIRSDSRLDSYALSAYPYNLTRFPQGGLGVSEFDEDEDNEAMENLSSLATRLRIDELLHDDDDDTVHESTSSTPVTSTAAGVSGPVTGPRLL